MLHRNSSLNSYINRPRKGHLCKTNDINSDNTISTHMERSHTYHGTDVTEIQMNEVQIGLRELTIRKYYNISP